MSAGAPRPEAQVDNTLAFFKRFIDPLASGPLLRAETHEITTEDVAIPTAPNQCGHDYTCPPLLHILAPSRHERAQAGQFCSRGGRSG